MNGSLPFMGPYGCVRAPCRRVQMDVSRPAARRARGSGPNSATGAVYSFAKPPMSAPALQGLVDGGQARCALGEHRPGTARVVHEQVQGDQGGGVLHVRVQHDGLLRRTAATEGRTAGRSATSSKR